jgi:hypothetical protein
MHIQAFIEIYFGALQLIRVQRLLKTCVLLFGLQDFIDICKCNEHANILGQGWYFVWIAYQTERILFKTFPPQLQICQFFLVILFLIHIFQTLWLVVHMLMLLHFLVDFSL